MSWHDMNEILQGDFAAVVYKRDADGKGQPPFVVCGKYCTPGTQAMAVSAGNLLNFVTSVDQDVVEKVMRDLDRAAKPATNQPPTMDEVAALQRQINKLDMAISRLNASKIAAAEAAPRRRKKARK